jgi:hypothetical protein
MGGPTYFVTQDTATCEALLVGQTLDRYASQCLDAPQDISLSIILISSPNMSFTKSDILHWTLCKYVLYTQKETSHRDVSLSARHCGSLTDR